MKQPLNNEESLYEDDEFFDNIDDGDYVFIMDAEGNLKTVMLPEEYNLSDIPEKVQDALQFFGISKIERRNLH